jgi:hypothetical protein
MVLRGGTPNVRRSTVSGLQILLIHISFPCNMSRPSLRYSAAVSGLQGTMFASGTIATSRTFPNQGDIPGGKTIGARTSSLLSTPQSSSTKVKAKRNAVPTTQGLISGYRINGRTVTYLVHDWVRKDVKKVRFTHLRRVKLYRCLRNIPCHEAARDNHWILRIIES